MVTTQDLLHFIRQDQILAKWSDIDILVAIKKAILQSAITWVEKDNTVLGVCFGEWKNREEFYVHYIGGKGQVKKMLNYLRATYPNCKVVCGERKKRWQEATKHFIVKHDTMHKEAK